MKRYEIDDIVSTIFAGLLGIGMYLAVWFGVLYVVIRFVKWVWLG